MSERLEALAKAIFKSWREGVENPSLEATSVRSARAALLFLGFDPENPPEEGAGGKARAGLEAAKEFLGSDVAQAAFTLQGIHGGAEPWSKDGKYIDKWLDDALGVAEPAKGCSRGEETT